MLLKDALRNLRQKKITPAEYRNHYKKVYEEHRRQHTELLFAAIDFEYALPLVGFVRWWAFSALAFKFLLDLNMTLEFQEFSPKHFGKVLQSVVVDWVFVAVCALVASMMFGAFYPFLFKDPFDKD